MNHRNYGRAYHHGAPVEQLEFEQVEYSGAVQSWSGAKRTFSAPSTSCWGAQRGCTIHTASARIRFREAVGVLPHASSGAAVCWRGFDEKDVHGAALPDHTTVLRAISRRVRSSDSRFVDALGRLCDVHEGGQVFITGHSEYDADTPRASICAQARAHPSMCRKLLSERRRTQPAVVSGAATANLLYQNWPTTASIRRRPTISPPSPPSSRNKEPPVRGGFSLQIAAKQILRVRGARQAPRRAA